MLSAKSAEYYCRAGDCIAKAHLTNDVLTKWWCITLADHWRRLAQNVESDALAHNVESDAPAQTEERHYGHEFGEYAGAFNPDEIRMMRDALNDALKATKASYAIGSNAQPARAALAKHIIEAAKQGERDPRRLSDIASRGLAKAHKG